MNVRLLKVILILPLLCSSACGEDDAGGEEGTRAVSGLSSCTVRIAGHYHIATALPYTGALAVIAPPTEQAIVQAVREVNDAGGVHGEKLGLVVCDSKGEETDSRRVMMELAGASPISAVIGPMRSSSFIAASEVSISRGITIVSPSATSPAITDLDDMGWVSRTAASDALQGQIVSALAMREGLDRVFVIYLDDAYGTGLHDVFTETFNAAGGTTGAVSYNPSTPDYAQSVVSAAMTFDPQGVFLVAFFDEGAAIVRQGATAGLAPDKWFFPDGLNDQDFVEAVANDAYLEGAVGTAPASPTGAEFEQFATKYRELWASDPQVFGANAYDAAYLVAISMQLSADPDDRVQVRDNLRQTAAGTVVAPGEWSKVLEHAGEGELDYAGASGPVDLDDSGDVVSNVSEWTVTAGTVETVGCWTPEATACP